MDGFERFLQPIHGHNGEGYLVCSQMKVQMKREALEKINRHAKEARGFGTVLIRFEAESGLQNGYAFRK